MIKKANNNILVEVGPGSSAQPDYIHCDINPRKHVEYVCNAWAIPFKAESVDEIYARHVLEHLTYKKAKRTLKHWLCVLKVGGRIDINVPDLGKHIEQLFEDGYSPYAKVTNKEHAMAGIYGWQNDDYDIHKWGYTFETLSKLLIEIGYSNIRRIVDTSNSGPLNIKIIAEKNESFSKLKLDPESLRPKWRYYNWNALPINILDTFKIKWLILKLLFLSRSIKTVFQNDYTGKGLRQASTTLDGIRSDHVGRYNFACKFINKNDTVLDCACGVGYGTFILAKETHLSNVIAIDLGMEAIEFARKYYHHDKITYKVGDIFSSDIPNDYFDCIVSFETVEHVDGPSLVNLFYKKLKKDGLLIISTPNQDTQPFNMERFSFHLRHYTPSEFSLLLTSNGFKIVGEYTQSDRETEEISKGWDGLFNIAIAKKI